MGMLRRIIDPIISRIHSGWLLIGLGVILLLNPLYIGMFHIDEPNWYRYDAAEITFENDTVNGQTAAIDDHDIACLSKAWRNCLFEHYVLSEDEIAIPLDPSAYLTSNQGSHRYAFLHGDFYRTTTEQRNGTEYLTVEQVDSTTALDAASTPLSEVSDSVRQVVKGGTVTTRDELRIEGELIQDQDTDRFYVLYQEASHQLGPGTLEERKAEGRIFEIGLMIFLGVVGLVAVLRGQRHRIERK